MQLETLLQSITPADQAAYDGCILQFDKVAKPIDGLGELERLLARAAAAQGGTAVKIDKKALVVFCADNGVVCEGVSQTDSSVTTAIARQMAVGKSSVCVMASACKADLFPVDVGMIDTVDGLLAKKLMPGTGNIAVGAAMTRETALEAILTGAEIAAQRKAEGYNLLAVGEAGIGNTTTTSAVAIVLLGRPVEELTGRGAGLLDEGLRRKQDAIRRAIAVNRPDADDVVDVLCKVGGLDIAAMTGLYLGCAANRIPIVMDGVIASVAALCAVRLCPDVRGYILPSHLSEEPAACMLCDALGFEPVLRARMHLGEGTGAVALFPLLDLAAAVYYDAAKFTDMQIEEYTRNT